MVSKWNIFVVSHTHWDREWYQTFQQFRTRLVRLIDKLLDILKKDTDFPYFTLDGQTVILEDFLEAEPDRRSELEELIKEGRILTGPWYVLPDEFLEGPEAIIRNLLLGHKIASEFGAVMKIGYLPDMFGHIGQMPQILNGFGIHEAVVFRGVGSDVDNTEFYWSSPDGSKVLTVYLRYGYCYGANLPTEKERFSQGIDRVVEDLSLYATTENLLLMNGCDHLEPQAELPAAIKEFNKKSSDIKLVHGTLPMYFKALKESNHALESYTGEFRSYGRGFLLPNVLSTRIWIKQRNFECERRLEKLAEPFSAWSWLADLSSYKNRMCVKRLSSLCWLAWKYLLKNHAHDSICGCSIDNVYRDVMHRFKVVEEISSDVIREGAEVISRHVKTDELKGNFSSEQHVLVVFNPVDGPRTDYVKASMEFLEEPSKLVARDLDETSPCHVLDIEKKEHYTVRLDRKRFRKMLHWIRNGKLWTQVLRRGKIRIEDETAYIELIVTEQGEPDLLEANRIYEASKELLEKNEVQNFIVRVASIIVELMFLAKNVPAYKTYVVEAIRREKKLQRTLEPPHKLENEFYRVEVEPEMGTVSMYDKETERLLPGCNLFVDGGDAGDEYNFSPPYSDLLISKPSEPPRITLLENGPIGSTLKIEMLYELPVGLTEDRKSRSCETREFHICSYVSLYTKIKRVEFKTVVDNNVDDHRLRAIFPTGVKTDHVNAEGHFDVVKRPVSKPEERGEFSEYPSGTTHQRSFVDVSDGQYGFMLTNKGLAEYEAVSGENGVELALTLLRSVGWLARNDFKTRDDVAGPIIKTPEAQCRGRQVFDYAVIPHKGEWGNASKQSHFFNNPLWAFETDFHYGELPLEQSWIEIEPSSLIISAVKMADDGKGIIVRFYNPGERDVNGKIKLYRSFAKAQLINLNEEPISKLRLKEDGWLNLKVAKKKLISIRFDF